MGTGGRLQRIERLKRIEARFERLLTAAFSIPTYWEDTPPCKFDFHYLSGVAEAAENFLERQRKLDEYDD
jgi:hypothetical protein